MKQREEIEIQKKRIRDLQLRHLMDQTEEYSKSMAKGLAKSTSQASFQNGPANADDMGNLSVFSETIHPSSQQPSFFLCLGP